MQTKKSIIALVFTVFLIFSCTQEDEIMSAEPSTIEFQQQRQIKKDVVSKFQYSIPSITPCGYGFKVDILFFGVPPVSTFEYQIVNGLGVVVDSGFVGDGQNTNWVLNPCQAYTFKYWAFGYGSPGAGDPPTTVLTATSDGCGGMFLC